MLVIYFSGTQNSKYIAQSFAKIMNADCHSIEENVDFASLIKNADTIAVCYPIYGSCVPQIMQEFTKKNRLAFDGKRLIIFCTQMMFSGDGARAFTRLLPNSQYRVIYAEHFNMPNNICNFWLFPIGNKERIRKKRAADKKLITACEDIKNGVVKRRGWGVFSALLGKIQNTSWIKIEKAKKSSFIANGDCNRCGMCVKYCPTKNLALTQNGVRQMDKCTLCYRCVNLCPQKAATVLINKKPKRQYKGIIPLPPVSFK